MRKIHNSNMLNSVKNNSSNQVSTIANENTGERRSSVENSNSKIGGSPSNENIMIEVNNEMAKCGCTVCGHVFPNANHAINHNCPERLSSMASLVMDKQDEGQFQENGHEVPSEPMVMENVNIEKRQNVVNFHLPMSPLTSISSALNGVDHVNPELTILRKPNSTGSKQMRLDSPPGAIKSHSTSTNMKSIECKICKESFPNSMEKYRHMLKVHGGSLKSIKCSKLVGNHVGCFRREQNENKNEMRGRRTKIRNEIENQLEGVKRQSQDTSKSIKLKMGEKITSGMIVPRTFKGKQLYVCGICFKIFSNSQDILEDVERHQNPNQKTLKTSDYSEDLNRLSPMDEIHTPQFDLFKNSVASLKQSRDLNRSTIQSQRLNFNGNVKFNSGSDSSAISLDSTLMKRTYRNGKTIYKCGVCSKKFKFPSQIKTHVKSHVKQNHLLKRSSLYCSQTFITESGLEKHENHPVSSSRPQVVQVSDLNSNRSEEILMI